MVEIMTGELHFPGQNRATVYHTAFSIILLIAVMVIVVDLVTGHLRRELSK